MNRMILRYGEDRNTGLPRLDDPSGSLSPADLAVLRGEIDRQFERLSAGRDGQVIANGPAAVRHFRVTVTEREKRCPTLLLEPVEPKLDDEAAISVQTVDATDDPPTTIGTGRWQNQFLAELADRLAALPADTNSRQPLDFVLSDLRALLRKKPKNFALLLLAGYLYVGDTLSIKHGEPGDNAYARAAMELLRLAGDLIVEGTLDPLIAPVESTSASPTPRVVEEESWLKRFFSFE